MGSIGLAERGEGQWGRTPEQPEARWRGMDTAPPQTTPEVFAASLHDLAPALYDFLHRLTGDAATANALLRQVAAQAAMSAASAGQWPSARAWLFARTYAALPATRAAASTDSAAFVATEPALLPPATEEGAVEEMARAVWRAISALSVEQHALVHLHTREAMVVGEAASVLGVTEREASDRLGRLLPAVESASRALFLIRYGRPRDPDLDALLNELNITRLTPAARARIEEYAAQSPRAQAVLRAAPPPLAVYAALRPLAPPSPVVEEAVAAALPWLAVAADSPAPPTEALTAPIRESSPGAGYGAGEITTPAALPWAGADTTTVHQYGYGYGAASPEPAPPEPPAAASDGTKMLDIPVRQRVVSEAAVYRPPRPTARRGIGPLALLGLLGGALILVVGALVFFLTRGDGGAGNVAVTATVGITATAPGSAVNAIPPANQTATVLASTITAPTAPPTATTAPRPPSAGTGTAASGSAEATVGGTPTPISPAATSTAAGTAIVTVIPTPPPRVTQIPLESPTPRVTAIPTAPPTASRPATTPTAAPTRAATATARQATTPATPAAPAAPAATATPTGDTGATAPSGGTIAVDKGSVSLGATGNAAAVTLSNKGPAASPYTAKTNTTWLAVSPASGTIPAGGTLPATISVDRSSLKAGQTYSGTITFTTASGASAIVTVTITT